MFLLLSKDQTFIFYFIFMLWFHNQRLAVFVICVVGQGNLKIFLHFFYPLTVACTCKKSLKGVTLLLSTNLSFQ